MELPPAPPRPAAPCPPLGAGRPAHPAARPERRRKPVPTPGLFPPLSPGSGGAAARSRPHPAAGRDPLLSALGSVLPPAPSGRVPPAGPAPGRAPPPRPRPRRSGSAFRQRGGCPLPLEPLRWLVALPPAPPAAAPGRAAVGGAAGGRLTARLRVKRKALPPVPCTTQESEQLPLCRP